MYNLKDIIRMNQEAGESGHLVNESSLQFTLSIIKHRKSWLIELSYLVRCLLVDHPFQDGNKRTAYVLCSLYFEDHKKQYDDQVLVDVIYKIAKSNIKDTNSISRRLKKCLTG